MSLARMCLAILLLTIAIFGQEQTKADEEPAAKSAEAVSPELSPLPPGEKHRRYLCRMLIQEKPTPEGASKR